LRHSIEYKFGQYRLTVNIWFLIIFLLVQTGLNELGFWQLSRAKEKQVRLEKVNQTDQSALSDLESLDTISLENFARVNIEVELAARNNLLVENRIQKGELGYHVMNIVREVKSNKFVLVNRGWIEGKADRSELPIIKLPAMDWNISARLYPINQQVLSGDAELENHGKIVRIPIMDMRMKALLEKRFQLELESYILKLDQGVPNSFDVEWEWVSMSPDKHLGYAFQWFALSFAFLVISLFVLIKKDRKDNSEKIDA